MIIDKILKALSGSSIPKTAIEIWYEVIVEEHLTSEQIGKMTDQEIKDMFWSDFMSLYSD